MKKKLLLMMSTYNGEKFLSSQLDSILNQTFNNFKIMVRDDGSTDSTKKILEAYKQKYSEKFEIIYGKNCGAKESFMKLVEQCDSKYEFYSFGDQDDIWKNNKIEKAIDVVEKKQEIPFLYFSNYDIVDENLEFIRKGYIKTEKNLTLKNSQVQCMGLGCTMVFNKKLLDILKTKKYSYENIIMHDYWLYLIASTFGEIYLDYSSTILYRQHGKNVFGSTIKWKEKIKNLFLRFDSRNTLYKYKAQASFFLKLYDSELEKENKKALKNFIKKTNFINRFFDVITKKIIFNNKSNYFVKITKSVYYILNRN